MRVARVVAAWVDFMVSGFSYGIAVFVTGRCGGCCDQCGSDVYELVVGDMHGVYFFEMGVGATLFCTALFVGLHGGRSIGVAYISSVNARRDGN